MDNPVALARLTKIQESFMLKKMRQRFLSLILALLLVSFFSLLSGKGKLSAVGYFVSSSAGSSHQEVKRPESDYMNTLLSRNTKPLGLKENPRMTRFLNQPGIKWAIRASQRHILN
jgi:hypothetical protein